MKRNGLIISLILVVLGSVTAGFAQNHIPGELEDDYISGDFGRVRYMENGVTIVRALSDPEGGSAVDGTVNAPVSPGDTVRTKNNQRAEIQLAGGSLVRLGRATELLFQALPDPYLEVRDNTILSITNGVIRISAVVDQETTFRVDTPAASIYLLGEADIKIEVGEMGRTIVSSMRGVAEIAGDGGSILVRSGMRSTTFPNSYPEDPRPFNTLAKDAFDRWSDTRDRVYSSNDHYSSSYDQETYNEIPYEVRPYYRELSTHGRWVRVNDYGWCWYPYDVGNGWRPYADGYWNYGNSGYFWVSHEPWGWAPYHYGRWDWVTGYGWCWIPGRIFGGAWVSWSWGSIHVGWSPLNYYNRPVMIGNPYYDYYSPHSWTFISYTNFHHRHYRRYAVSVHDVGPGIRGGAIVTRPPRVRPRDLARDPDARIRAVRDARKHAVTVRLPGPGKDGGSGAAKRRFIDGEDRLIRRGVPTSRRGSIEGRNKAGNGPLDPVVKPGNRGRKPVNPGAGRVPSPGRTPGGPTGRPGTPVRTPGRDKATVPGTSGKPAPYQRSRVLTGRDKADTRDGSSMRRSSGSGGSTRDTGNRGGLAGRRSHGSNSDRSERQPSAPSSPRVRPRQSESDSETGNRVRDMYRRLSEPKTTHRTKSSTDSSRSGGSRDKAREQVRPERRESSSSRRQSPPRTSPSPGRSYKEPRAQPRTQPRTPTRQNTPRVTQPRSAPKPSAPRVNKPRQTPKPSAPRVNKPRQTPKPSAPRPSTGRSTPKSPPKQDRQKKSDGGSRSGKKR